MLTNRTLASTGFALTFLLVIVTASIAQEVPGLPEPSALAQQSLRPYWHVFAAYAIVILLIGGWAFSIARRLKGVEERLGD